MTDSQEKATVLVVDDEPRILDSIRALLEEDFQVESSTDAERALSLFESVPVAVVLADQRMPGLTGDQFLAKAREVSDATRILITGYADIDALIQAVNGGGIHTYIPKPWDPSKLQQAVADAVERFRDVKRKRAAEQVVMVQQEALARSAAAFRDQTKLLRSILDSMGDGVLVTNDAGQVLVFNPAAEGLVGSQDVPQSPGELSQNVQVCHGDTMAPIDPSDLPLMRAGRGEVVDGAELYIKRTGIYLSVNARPLRDDDGNPAGAVAVLHNVTTKKLAEEQLRRAKEEAEQANRAKSEFLSRMSHELRTPLNSILGFAQLLEMDSLNALQNSSVNQILKGGHHLLKLINEVLDIARIEAGRLSLSMEPIRVADALDEALEMVRPLAARQNITLSVAASVADGLFIQADRQRLLQVLLNLLSNAVKYNRPDGIVSISCREKCAGRIEILVSDTGFGIPEEKMHLLFSPFERLGAEQTSIEGTGVGLALSERLMEAMNGAIGASSRPGEGSVFWVEFQQADSVQWSCYPTADEAFAVSGESVGPGHTVLYIEDNLPNIELMQQIFSMRPQIRLITAMQGGSGLDQAREHLPDLILLDNHLPDISGEQVLRHLKADGRTRDIPVAIVSADGTEARISRLLGAGAQQCFTKPLSVRELLEFTDATLRAW